MLTYILILPPGLHLGYDDLLSIVYHLLAWMVWILPYATYIHLSSGNYRSATYIHWPLPFNDISNWPSSWTEANRIILFLSSHPPFSLLSLTLLPLTLWPYDLDPPIIMTASCWASSIKHPPFPHWEETRSNKIPGFVFLTSSFLRLLPMMLW